MAGIEFIFTNLKLAESKENLLRDEMNSRQQKSEKSIYMDLGNAESEYNISNWPLLKVSSTYISNWLPLRGNETLRIGYL